MRPGARGAWMRLRFAISGEAAPGAEIVQADVETKPPDEETGKQQETTNENTKIEAATGN
jgi:two-component system nitrogen regulation sensor histidine kinase NtrY